MCINVLYVREMSGYRIVIVHYERQLRVERRIRNYLLELRILRRCKWREHGGLHVVRPRVPNSATELTLIAPRVRILVLSRMSDRVQQQGQGMQ